VTVREAATAWGIAACVHMIGRAGKNAVAEGHTVSHLPDGELKKISALLATGDLANAREIVRLLKPELRESLSSRRKPTYHRVNRPMSNCLSLCQQPPESIE
jgi:hypothetical protein